MSVARLIHPVRVGRCIDVITVGTWGQAGTIALLIDGRPTAVLDLAQVRAVGEEAGSGEFTVVITPPLAIQQGNVIGFDVVGCALRCDELRVMFFAPAIELPPRP